MSLCYQGSSNRHMQRKTEKAKAQQLRQSSWWKTICQRTNCYYCAKLISGKDVTMDHIVPISRGGRSTRGNLVPACKPCNTIKKDRTAVDWLLEN